ncbi:NUDIX domain-containing protein [Embleya sp. NBC_00896]|uniref:NUDIX domain-containing protein n=1 Tax=Embleya sp. NBC_00896 TaxID=2975961 RepID=UPI002F912C72|nr:NUDIX domain-containing protein [Embleya sp. NBC_00896]
MSDHRHNAIAYAAIILERADGAVLFMERKDTGFADGLLALPGGLADPGEMLVEACARETKEEVGADVAAADLRTAFVSQVLSETGTPVIGWYFHATRWAGDPVNAEPDQCARLTWLDPTALPTDVESTDAAAVRAWHTKSRPTLWA